MCKPVLYLTITTLFMISACSKSSENPFFLTYQTPFETPPFDQISNEHYLPAFEKGMQEHQDEIAAITNNDTDPTFENTIAVLDRSGALLTKSEFGILQFEVCAYQ